MSTFSGRLSLKKITMIRTRPATNAKLVKLCTYLATCEMLGEGLRADHRQQQDLAEGDVEAGQAENDEGHRRQPMRKSLEGLEAENLLPGAPCRDPEPSHDQIGGAQNRDHAEDHDRAAPMQQNLVEIVPGPSRGLDQHAGLGVGNVDAPFDARRLLEQRRARW